MTTKKASKKPAAPKPIRYKTFAAVLRAKANGNLPRGAWINCGKGALFKLLIPGQTEPALDMGTPIPALFAVLRALGIKGKSLNI